MWIRRLRAEAFGPFVNQVLDLAPGMTVIYGPNESVIAACPAPLLAGVGGRRRARAAPRAEDRVFAERHRPWDGTKWLCSVEVELADGRLIEVRQDLDGQVDCRAVDLGMGGRDVSAECMNEGAPDGALFLGLDRRSFLATACIRQSQILSVRESASSLQDVLQRAAASARDQSTAGEALRLIESFERDEVGSDRAPSRPFRIAQAARDEARDRLRVAEAHHVQYLEIAARVDQARLAAERAAQKLSVSEAAALAAQAREAEGRIEEARDLARAYAYGAPAGDVADAEMARQVATAIAGWESRPAVQEVDGDPAALLQSRLDVLERAASGDRSVRPTVAAAREAHRAARALVEAHAAGEPPAPPPVLPGGDTGANELFALADRLAQSGTGHSSWVTGRWRLPGAIGVGLLAFGAGLLLDQLLLGIAVAAIATILGVVPLPRQRASERPVDGLEEELRRRGLPVAVQALRELARERDTAEATARTRASWETRRVHLSVEERGAADRLLAAIREGEPDVDSDIDLALVTYEQRCQARAEAYSEAERLRHRLDERQRRDLERVEAETTVAHRRDALMVVGRALNIPEQDPDAMIEALHSWESERTERMAVTDARRAGWARLQALLNGSTLAELEDSASRTAAEAVRALNLVSSDVRAAISAGQSLDLPARDDLQLAEREARDTLTRLETELLLAGERVESVAAAQEQLSAAEAECARLEGLRRTLRTAQNFLSEAVEQVHRTIAPVLQASLNARLSVVTNNRYQESLVDPETLAVRVRAASGSWREADRLSQGTTEQVYLLLRIALAEHLTKEGEATPLILDDVTVQSDGVRTARILETLHDVARHHQVILLSQEDDVLDWARRELAEPRDRLIELAAT
jgi:exonuclease SbcC